MKFLFSFISLVIIPFCVSAQLKLLKDINPGAAPSMPRIIGTTTTGLVFFSANDGTHGNEIWVSDGTTGGTTLLKDINPGVANGIGDNLKEDVGIVYNNKLYFAANDGIHGTEMWVSDGNSKNTYMIKDVNLGTGSSVFDYIPSKVGMNNIIYYCGSDGVSAGLWRTDGTDTGTKLVYNTTPNATNYLYASNNKLYFTATDATALYGKWYCSDGTTSGTKMLFDKLIDQTTVTNIVSGGRLTEFNGALYFSGADSAIVSGGLELCKIENDSVSIVFKVPHTSKSNGTPEHYVQAFDKLYFSTIHGTELWMTDGSPAGTKLIGQYNGIVYAHGVLNGQLLYGGVRPNTGFELGIMDSSGNNDKVVKDITPGTYWSLAQWDRYQYYGRYYKYNYSSIYKGKYYFMARSTVSDNNVWMTDGTDTGTVILARANKNKNDPDSAYFATVINDKVWVGCSDGQTGYELYLSDLLPDPKVSVHKIGNNRLSTVVPNPSHGRILVKLDNNSFISGNLIITDITGKAIYSQTIDRNSRQVQVSLNSVPGTYFLSIYLDGDMMSHKLYIK